jgi:hypothetical protein
MKRVPLNRRKNNKNSGKHFALVDDKDYDRVMKMNWCVVKYKHTFYAMRAVLVDGKYVFTRMHRFIIKAKSGEYVDHIDHNGLNNQRSNLRICTNKKNTWNSRSMGVHSSRYKGVSWDKRRGNWSSDIHPNGKHIYLGAFKKEEDAAKAYNEAALIHYGEFANLNIISRGKH